MPNFCIDDSGGEGKREPLKNGIPPGERKEEKRGTVCCSLSRLSSAKCAAAAAAAAAGTEQPVGALKGQVLALKKCTTEQARKKERDRGRMRTVEVRLPLSSPLPSHPILRILICARAKV